MRRGVGGVVENKQTEVREEPTAEEESNTNKEQTQKDEGD